MHRVVWIYLDQLRGPVYPRERDRVNVLQIAARDDLRIDQRQLEDRLALASNHRRDAVVITPERDVSGHSRIAPALAERGHGAWARGDGAQHITARMNARTRHQSHLGQAEGPDRALRIARHHERDVFGYRRVERPRQEHAGAVGDLARELEDLGLRQLPRLGVEILHRRQPARDRREIELAEDGHQDLPPLNAGMTSRPKSRRLASTSACGIVSAVLTRKLTRSTPHASQRLSARVMRSGPPRQSPSPACSEAPGPAAWRRTSGRRRRE